MNAKDLQYRPIIIDRLDRQTEKGIRKYGGTIDKSGHLKTVSESLEYLAEELTDALVYIEHGKRQVRSLVNEAASVMRKWDVATLALRAIAKCEGEEALIAQKALKDMGME
ncbi:hypothetical protein NDK47_24150 [Brevibacillus ruminantium]|uniref:Uncharacterized protein n=1 Tax=Brevibacillus ruminantium TaxID=2950604 RepID=A0ABY4WIK6_9BACL|nr:hypothetical protein [Brevibacillus ruminantium]USG65179.1 hypothetical protein NDK47_24150 [Brevibacillus ruminantium]